MKQLDSENPLYTKLVHSIRCSVCQNQSLAESDAPVMVALRSSILEQVKNGQSEQEILSYVVSRYGEFVLYRPPFEPGTLVLWFGPLFMLVLGCLFFKKQFKL